MNAFTDAAREHEALTRRVKQLEIDVRTLLSRRSGELERTAYRPREVAQMLGCHPQTVRDLINSGRLRAERMNGWWAIPAAAVNQLLEPEPQHSGPQQP